MCDQRSDGVDKKQRRSSHITEGERMDLNAFSEWCSLQSWHFMCSVHRFLNKVQFIINYTYDLLMTIFFWSFLLAFSSALSSSLFKELHQMVEHCFCWTDAEVQKCCHLRGPTHFRRLSTIVSSQRVFRVTTSGMICSFGGVLPNFFLSTSSVTKGNLWDRGSIAIMDDGQNQSVWYFYVFSISFHFCCFVLHGA